MGWQGQGLVASGDSALSRASHKLGWPVGRRDLLTHPFTRPFPNRRMMKHGGDMGQRRLVDTGFGSQRPREVGGALQGALLGFGAVSAPAILARDAAARALCAAIEADSREGGHATTSARAWPTRCRPRRWCGTAAAAGRWRWVGGGAGAPPRCDADYSRAVQVATLDKRTTIAWCLVASSRLGTRSHASHGTRPPCWRSGRHYAAAYAPAAPIRGVLKAVSAAEPRAQPVLLGASKGLRILGPP
jgi:hypothetical protein